MTEKRFVKGYHTIRDIKENNVYDFQVNIICDLLNEQEKLIKRLKTIREEQTETILKQKRKIKELELCNQGKYIYGVHGGSNDRK